MIYGVARQKSIQHCKAIILQLKINFFKKLHILIFAIVS